MLWDLCWLMLFYPCIFVYSVVKNDRSSKYRQESIHNGMNQVKLFLSSEHVYTNLIL